MIEIDSPIIFIGSGRSGTTIISDTIFRHEDLAFPSNYQEKFPGSVGINRIRPLFDNDLWRLFGKRTKNRNLFNLHNYVFRPTEGYRMWDYLHHSHDFSKGFLWGDKAGNREEIRTYFEKMVTYQRRKRLAFKITGPGRIGYLLSIFPNPYFVDIRRRIIPTVNSFLNVSFWDSNTLHWQGVYSKEEKEWFESHLTKPYLTTAFQIKRVLDITNKELEVFSPNYIKVHYDELLNNPKKVINDILKFVSLRESKSCSSYITAIKVENKIKKDEDYFSIEKISEIQELFGDFTKYE